MNGNTGRAGQDKLLRNILIGAIIVATLLLVALGFGAQWYLSPENNLSIVERRDLVQGMASVGQALAVFLTGAVGLIGLFFTWRNTRQAQESTKQTLKLTEQGQITDRFTKAIDQLGKTDDNDKKISEIRLGGIYALAQIAVESPKEYHWTIVRIFTGYLQNYASWQGDRLIQPEEDIQAILNILGTRDRSYDPEDELLYLGNLDLSHYSLPSGGHFERAIFGNTHFESADLSDANLQEVSLRGARLQGANLFGVDLSSADLRGADLEGAYLPEAVLKDANLGGANLSGTYLAGANLLEAKGLDRERLIQANGQTHPSWATQVAEDNRPSWWTLLPHDESWEQDQERKQLEPGDYSIKLSRTPLHFSLSQGWYATLNHPYAFSLTRTGVSFTGSILTFRSDRWVCDPQKPSEQYAYKRLDEDMLTWFLGHPCLDKMNQEWPEIGGVHATQFDAEIRTPEDKLLTIYGNPMLPLFPIAPRTEPFVLNIGYKHRIIVLTRQDESMVITIEGPPDEFYKFYELVQEVLSTVYWGEKPREQPEGA